MGALASAFYKDLYTSEGTKDMESVLSTVPAKVTAAMNEHLMKSFEKEEVKTALFQMSPTKAPVRMGYRHTSSNAIGSCAVVRFQKLYFGF